MIVINDVQEARALADEIKEVYFICNDYKKAFSTVTTIYQIRKSVLKVGDRFISVTSGIISEILSITDNELVLSQRHDIYGYYENLVISRKVLTQLLLRGLVEKLEGK